MKERIYFVLDGNRLRQAVTPLFQLRNSGKEVIVFDVGQAHAPLDKEVVRKIIHKLPYVSFRRIRDTWYECLPGKCGLPSHCYARLNIPEEDPEADMGLYLDTDIHIRQDINRIFDYGLHETEMIGGAADLPLMEWHKGSWYPPTREMINSYINGGVLLMNLQKMREFGFLGKAKEYALQNQPEYQDQDTLNAVIRNKRLLPVGFNSQRPIREYYGCRNLHELDITIWHYVHDYSRPDMETLDEGNIANCPFYDEYRRDMNEAWELLGLQI